MRVRILGLGASLLVSTSLIAQALAASGVPDAHELADINGHAAMHWVRAENARTFASLEADPRYKGFYSAVLAAEQSPARLAMPDLQGGGVWNFWQDAHHPRGILRATSFDEYQRANPSWTTKLDIDALSKQENANWVYKGADCLAPSDDLCLIGLSDGGEDATSEREYDAKLGKFVSGGFTLPSGKQDMAWFDRDTLLVARDWSGTGADLTQSGYPYVLKLWRRGTPLNTATEVLRGTPKDVSVGPVVLNDETGRQLVLVQRGIDFFTSQYWVVERHAGGISTRSLDLPSKMTIMGLSSGRLILELAQDWKAGASIFTSGSVIAVDPAGPEHAVELIATPNAHQAFMDGAVTHRGVLLTGYEDVQPRATLFKRSQAGQWTSTAFPLAPNTSVEIAAASPSADTAYLSVQGYIQPPQLWSVDTVANTAHLLRATPNLFDTHNLTVEQLWAKSPDGTRVPYFLTHRKDMKLDGKNPVLLTAYGGFQASYLPTYYPDIGATWLAHGGVYAVANIRGGGEFGPAWHEAARKSKRQNAYDDFAAVGQDMIARNITTTAHLGIRGRSNGGLLMGVEFTQHPELWKAVIIGVPLLDMLHYETMAAGASWAAEYGSASNSSERPFLERISPLQNLKSGVSYPTPFIFTSTKDDRVGPVHARLFASRLHDLNIPFYYYEDTEGGHAGTVNAQEIAHERALEAVYLTRALADKSAH